MAWPTSNVRSKLKWICGRGVIVLCMFPIWQYPLATSLLLTTDIHINLTAIASNIRRRALSVLFFELSSIPSLVLVMDTVELIPDCISRGLDESVAFTEGPILNSIECRGGVGDDNTIVRRLSMWWQNSFNCGRNLPLELGGHRRHGVVD